MPKTFECPACGAPVTAKPGEEVMPCPYCGAALTIPPRLRRKRNPQITPEPPRPRDPFSAAASVRLDEKTLERRQRETEMLANGLRRAQPIAHKAVWAYNSWILARRYLPGCLAIAILACLLTCALIAAIGIYLGRSAF
jgi:uncharacterized Zn finger protein (UPF0148 family)